MPTQIPNFYSINGVIDTSKSVLENMNLIAEASGCWMTYDIHQGKWAVVINNTGSSVASFNTSNILGSVTISSTSLTEVYNSVEMEFPHKDLTDEPDHVVMSIAAGNRYPNEPDNILTLSSQLINNQAQAQSIAARQLKQNRIDKVVTFQTDYSYIGLKAGELISITLDIYSWNSKLFRITSISEEDADDGNILVSITALEYDASVYSTSGLVITPRSRQNGITAATLNSYIKQSDQTNTATVISSSGAAAGLISAYDPTLGKYVLSLGSQKVTIQADRAIITWTFQDGSDLDIRCQLIRPNYITDVESYLGWTGTSGNDPRYSTSSSSSIGPSGITQGTPIQSDWLVWGGDNTGVGTENVLVNLSALKTSFPTRTYFAIECRGNWYGTRGIKPISLNVTAYQDGTIADDAANFNWTVTNYTDAKFVKGLDTFINSNTTDPTALGDLMGYFVFDVANNTAQFVYGLGDITNQYGAT